MSNKKIGDILREARVQKKFTLDDVEKKTTIPTSHLLALELSQFKLIPEELVEAYLEQYSQAVDLDRIDLLDLYRSGKVSEEGPREDDKEEKSQEGEVKFPVEENLVDEHDTEAFSKSEKEDKTPVATGTSVGSRVSRHKMPSRRPSVLPIILLCMISLAILSFVFFIAWNQIQKDNKEADNTAKSSQVSTSFSSESEASSEAETTMTSEVTDNNLTVTVSNAEEPVELVIALSGAESLWMSVASSETGVSEVNLSSAEGAESFTSSLSPETTTAITFGLVEGITVTVDGQELDLSALSGSASITLTIE